MEYVVNHNSEQYDNLIIGLEIPLMTTGIELLESQGILTKGSILTKNEAGKYVLCNSVDDVLEGILTDDVDTDKETIATIYRQGHFNKDALIFGENVTKIDDLERNLKEINILLSSVQ